MSKNIQNQSVLAGSAINVSSTSNTLYSWVNNGRNTYYNNGNVAINKSSIPNYNLDVNGSLNATTIYLNGSPVSAGSGSQWTTNGSTIYYNGGNVGINNATPLYKVDIGGALNCTGGIYLNGSLMNSSQWATSGSFIYTVNNISINKSTNAYPLDISGGMQVSSFIVQNMTNNNVSLGNNNLSSLSGTSNTSVGFNNLKVNTSGCYNSAFGSDALYSNVSSYYNCAFGYNSLYSCTNGANTGYGVSSLSSLVLGTSNVAIGYESGSNIASGALSSNNTFLGASTGFSTSATYLNSTAIGYNTKITASNQIKIGTSTETVIIDGSLTVAGDIRTASSAGLFLRMDTNNSYIQYYGSGHTFYFVMEGGIKFAIDYGAVVYANQYASLSDDRLKTNETFITDATTTVLKLRPQLYHKYLDLDCSGNYSIESGLVAQEIYYDAPELRHIVKLPLDASPVEGITSSTDPSIDPDYSSWGTTPASVNYSALIPYLIKSIQELHLRIAVLEGA